MNWFPRKCQKLSLSVHQGKPGVVCFKFNVKIQLLKTCHAVLLFTCNDYYFSFGCGFRRASITIECCSNEGYSGGCEGNHRSDEGVQIATKLITQTPCFHKFAYRFSQLIDFTIKATYSKPMLIFFMQWLVMSTTTTDRNAFTPHDWYRNKIL